MNKKLLSLTALAACVAFSFTACSDDDDEEVHVASVDPSADNIENWGNYMTIVSKLLANDATALYSDWATDYNNTGRSYATYFKSSDLTAQEAAQQIIDGCKEIANEVGESKIGEPISLWADGKKEKAVLAVESWYSWHSRDDYSNNIRSIRNSYYGTTDGTVAANSLSSLVKAANAELDTKVVDAINNAIDKIQAIPQPFRNNLGSDEAVAAQTACKDLCDLFEGNLKKCVASLDDDDALQAAVDQYVDNVVLPTYADLAAKNGALYLAVQAFAKAPSTATFAACGVAWLAARQPWETSEAFLYGPVADKGLDPNMDSWPLDQNGIENILSSADYSQLNWDGEFDEESEAIASAQSLRGFHTLEFLIFKDGKARTYSE